MEFHKFRKIKVIGDKDNELLLANLNDIIDIEEKIDGANFRTYIQPDGKKFYGSHNRILDDDNFDDVAWKRCILFLDEKLKEYFPEQDTIIYGECCISHTMSYDWDKIPPFLAFDIMVDEKFLPYNEKIAIFEELNIPYVPLIKRITAGELLKLKIEDLVPISEYASKSNKDQLAEGIVIKNYKEQIFAKFVRDVFKEKNREIFGGSPKHATDEEHRWTLMYATNPRIEKAIMKLINDGNVLEMPLMRKLPNFVWDDIWEEEVLEIVRIYKSLEFHECRKMMTKRCLHILQNIITNQNLLKKE